MPLKLVINNDGYCRIQGKRYGKDICREKKELEDILNLKRLIHKRYDELIYTEILLTRKEENLRIEKEQKKHENTYNEFIESLKRIRAEREEREKNVKL